MTDEEIAEFEQTHKLKVLKTSAKLGKGVDEAFLEMTKSLIKKQNSMTTEERLKQNGKFSSKGGSNLA